MKWKLDCLHYTHLVKFLPEFLFPWIFSFFLEPRKQSDFYLEETYHICPEKHKCKFNDPPTPRQYWTHLYWISLCSNQIGNPITFLPRSKPKCVLPDKGTGSALRKRRTLPFLIIEFSGLLGLTIIFEAVWLQKAWTLRKAGTGYSSDISVTANIAAIAPPPTTLWDIVDHIQHIMGKDVMVLHKQREHLYLPCLKCNPY